MLLQKTTPAPALENSLKRGSVLGQYLNALDETPAIGAYVMPADDVDTSNKYDDTDIKNPSWRLPDQNIMNTEIYDTSETKRAGPSMAPCSNGRSSCNDSSLPFQNPVSFGLNYDIWKSSSLQKCLRQRKKYINVT